MAEAVTDLDEASRVGNDQQHRQFPAHIGDLRTHEAVTLTAAVCEFQLTQILDVGGGAVQTGEGVRPIEVK